MCAHWSRWYSICTVCDIWNLHIETDAQYLLMHTRSKKKRCVNEVQPAQIFFQRQNALAFPQECLVSHRQLAECFRGLKCLGATTCCFEIINIFSSIVQKFVPLSLTVSTTECTWLCWVALWICHHLKFFKPRQLAQERGNKVEEINLFLYIPVR